MGNLVGSNLWSPPVHQSAGEVAGGVPRRVDVAEKFIFTHSNALYTRDLNLGASSLIHTFSIAGTLTGGKPDHINGKYIGLSQASNDIRTINFDGTSETIILSGSTSGPITVGSTLHIDEDNQKLYWTGINKIGVSNLDGSSPSTIPFPVDLANLIRGVYYYPPDDKLYVWTKLQIYRCNTDGTDWDPVGGLPPFASIEIYNMVRNLNGDYFVASNWERIFKLNKSYGSLSAWVDLDEGTLHEFRNIWWDHASNYIYSIVRSNDPVVGGNYKFLDPDLTLSAHTDAADTIYDASFGYRVGIKYEGNLVGVMGVSGASPELSDLVPVSPVAQKLFWTAEDDVYSVDIGVPSSTTQVRTGAEGDGSYSGIGIDNINQKVIVACPGTQRLKSMNFDGSGLTTLIASPVALSSITPVVVDETNGKVYWGGTAAFYSMNLDGTSNVQLSTKSFRAAYFYLSDGWIYCLENAGSPYTVWKIRPGGTSEASVGSTLGANDLCLMVADGFIFTGDFTNGDINKWDLSMANSSPLWFKSVGDSYALAWDHSRHYMYALHRSAAALSRGIYHFKVLNESDSLQVEMSAYPITTAGTNIRTLAISYNTTVAGKQ